MRRFIGSRPRNRRTIATGKKTRLYDIPADAAEKQDLATKLPDVRARMETALAAWKSGVMAELKAVSE